MLSIWLSVLGRFTSRVDGSCGLRFSECSRSGLRRRCWFGELAARLLGLIDPEGLGSGGRSFLDRSCQPRLIVGIDGSACIFPRNQLAMPRIGSTVALTAANAPSAVGRVLIAVAAACTPNITGP